MTKRELYQALLQRQGGTCAICGCPPGKRKLSVDHDHKTNKIRGLLCSNCNFAVGLFRDNPELMFVAAEYVSEEQWEAQEMRELNEAWRKYHGNPSNPSNRQTSEAEPTPILKMDSHFQENFLKEDDEAQERSVVLVVGMEAQVEVKNSFGQSPKGGIPSKPIPEFDSPFVFTER